MRSISKKDAICHGIAYGLFVLYLIIFFFFPFWKTDYGMYFSTIILPVLCAGVFSLFMVLIYHPAASRKPMMFWILLIAGLAYVAVNLYVTARYHSWPWDLINKSLSLLFLFTIMFRVDRYYLKQYCLIETVIIVGAFSSLAAILFFAFGYDGIKFRDFQFVPYALGSLPDYSDVRLTWIYPHKSTHSMILLLLSALTLTHLQSFRRKIFPILCLAIFAVAMYLADTVAATAGLVLIYIGYFAYLLLKDKPRKVQILLLCISGILGTLALYGIYQWIASVRNIASLGSRFPIWNASLDLICDNPLGLGSEFSKVIIWKWADNAHNTFLNEILHFGIAVGGLYLLFFLLFMAGTCFKYGTFSLAIWIAFMISINMDYTLQAHTLSMVLLLLYLTFLVPVRTKKRHSLTDSHSLRK